MYIFGPVPSRRLGKSLGINVIPPEHCSYSCVYCQLGLTKKMHIDRIKIGRLELIRAELEKKLELLKTNGEEIDYLTLVADGEPTLALELGEIIDLLRGYGIKVAIICNSSLLWKNEVRKDLLGADWVSLKCDSVLEETWKKIDRPHGHLKLNKIKEGMLQFSQEYQGDLVSETMLVKGINDRKNEIKEIAGFLDELSVDVSYLAVPTRPPAEKYAVPASYEFINMAYNIFKNKGLKVEYLLGYEGNQFSSTGDIKEDLLSITAVHPLKREAVVEMLKKSQGDWKDVNKLIDEEKIVEVAYEGDKYYIRKI